MEVHRHVQLSVAAASHALPPMIQHGGGAMRDRVYSSASCDCMPYPYPMPVAMIPEHATTQTWMQQSPSQSPSWARLQTTMSHSSVSQFSPAAADPKLAKKLERLQRVAQKRRKQQQQQQQQQQQPRQTLDAAKVSPSAQRSSIVVIRNLPNNLCNADSLEVTLGVAGLEKSIFKYDTKTGDTFGEAVLHLDSSEAADRCIEYFQGRQWGRLRGPPHPVVTAELAPDTALHTVMPNIVLAATQSFSSSASPISAVSKSDDGRESEQEDATKEELKVCFAIPSILSVESCSNDVSKADGERDSEHENATMDEVPLLSPLKRLRPRISSTTSTTDLESQVSTPRSSKSPNRRWADMLSDDEESEDWAFPSEWSMVRQAS